MELAGRGCDTREYLILIYDELGHASFLALRSCFLSLKIQEMVRGVLKQSSLISLASAI